MLRHGVDASSKLDILLSKRSEGKKKKGNAPVAGTDVLTLGELLKKQEQEKGTAITHVQRPIQLTNC